MLGEHTAYVERTNLTSRQMNGRLVRKTLSFSKELRFLKAASALEDALYNFTRPSRHYVLKWKTPQNAPVGNNERLLWLLNSQTIFGV